MITEFNVGIKLKKNVMTCSFVYSRVLAARAGELLSLEDEGVNSAFARTVDYMILAPSIPYGMKCIIDTHHREIPVGTKTGLGTTFTIRLPIKPEPVNRT